MIFPSCGLAASDMPLRLILLQYILNLRIQRYIVSFKPFGKVFMYGGLAYSKMFGCRPNGGFVLYYVLRQFYCAPFNIGFQMHHSNYNTAKIYGYFLRDMI